MTRATVFRRLGRAPARRRPGRRTAGPVLIALVTVLTGVALLPSSPAAARPAATVVEPTLLVAPNAGGVVAAGAPLDLTVEVTNRNTTALPPGSLQFSLDREPVASATTLLDGIAQPAEALQGYLLTTTATTTTIQPGDSQRLRVRIPAAAVDSVLTAASGTRLVYAKLDAGAATGDGVIAEAAVTRMAKGFSKRVGLAAVVPITAPANATGLVDVATQDRLTTPGGAWDDALRAAQADPSATVALDPEVPASIRLAGSTAPSGATMFLAALAALPNPVVPLPYADADLTLTRAAGAAEVLTPSSFAGSSTAATSSPSSTAGPTPTPAPTGTEPTPTRGQLLAWDWSGSAVAWPVRGTVSTADLGLLAADDRTVLLASGDVRGARAAAGPAARIRGAHVLIADAQASALLSRAGTRGPSGAAALAALVGVLGTDAVTGAVPALLAVPDRGSDPSVLDRAMSVLHAQSWIDGRTLTDLAKGSVTSVSLATKGQPAARVATADRLLSSEAAVRALGTAVQDAGPLVGPEQLALLGLLSASWRLDESGWNTAASDGAKRFDTFVDQVHVNQGSPILYTGDASTVSVNVFNELPQQVTVVVRGTASNGRLRVTGDGVRLTVPANSGSRAKLPVRSITNGKVTVAVRLYTPAGAPIGGATTQVITVRAGFEVIVAVAVIAALGLLFLTGIYRNVFRPRRRRTRKAA